MSFTDQKPRIATEQDLKGRWGSGFRCYLCGDPFKIGDQYRWIYCGEMSVINALVCKSCDGQDVKERWKKQHDYIYAAAFWMREDRDKEPQQFGSILSLEQKL